jgi:hypothetical protein
VHSLIREMPERAGALRARLDAILDDAAALRAPTTIAPLELTEHDLAQLRAMGYEP